VEFPKNCLVTIIKVKTSKDLRYAKVYLSVMPEAYITKVAKALKARVGKLQFLLNKKLAMRPLPHLYFTFDDTEAQAADLEALLDRIKKTS
jgi:ribosome-binding factor A